MRVRTRTLALAGAGLLALGGTGAALAAGHGHRGAGDRAVLAGGPARHDRGGLFAAAASYLGISTSELRGDLQGGKTLGQVADATQGKSSAGLVAALVAGVQQKLAAAVSAGKLTQTQADSITTRLQQRIGDLVNGTRPPFPRGGFGRPAGGSLAAAATYLGISGSDLRTDLQAGKTLGQIADGTAGKSSAGLVAALVADAQQKPAAAVSAGKLTQAQADSIAASLQQRITDLVNGTRPAFPRGGFGHRGHGGWNAAGANV